ncbi:MAG: beta-ketoacyl-ACP synthase III [Anaerolineales bacterium]|nr:beta-ketoacyl-ACP synthase III [Anaerolineales bacterium]
MADRYGNIVGWGKYVPPKVITNADLEETLATSDEKIFALTGIRERHVVSPGENTSQMATDAARDALDMAGVRARDLGLIIVATSSPDHLTPPVSSQVQHALGAKDVGAFTLVAGCPGFIYGLATAQHFITSGSCDNVLVVGAELISRYTDWTDRGTCVLFGDGAGAVVMQVSDEPAGMLAYTLGSDGSGAELLILPGGGTAIPPTHESLDQGLHLLKMDGNQVFRSATRILGKALRQTIQQAGLTNDDIDLFVPHQSNARIIESIAQYVKFPEEKVFVNIERYGNTSAASIPIALCDAFDEGRAKVGDTLAFTAFGAGLTWATAVMKISERVQPIPVRRMRVLEWLSVHPFGGMSRYRSSRFSKILTSIFAPMRALRQRLSRGSRE